ncbi:hypothetical protein B0T14DRAFT_500570 [Immersiella caudata]|uniref:Uncharacterized protein n=1 Tax=Immersiella caudata TaxID=314043 RepID=A0AA39U498_9PEZI|nr:hypothetical protein B0T14DRAFT_500570 [Immersiella caudata]
MDSATARTISTSFTAHRGGKSSKMTSIFGPGPTVNTDVATKSADADYLTKLPAEILQMICDRVVVKWNKRSRRDLTNLAKTHRVLQDLAYPMLFSEITMDRVSTPDFPSSAVWGRFSKEDAKFLPKLSREVIGLKQDKLIERGRSIYVWFDSTIHASALLLGLAPKASSVSMTCCLGDPRNILNSRHKAQNRRRPKTQFEGVKEFKFNLKNSVSRRGLSGGDLWGVTELLTALPNLEKLELVGGFKWTFKAPTKFDAPSITSLVLAECELSSEVLEQLVENFDNLVEFRFSRHSDTDLVPPGPAPSFILRLTQSSKATLEKLAISCIHFSAATTRIIPPTWTKDAFIGEISGYQKLQHLSLGAECLSGISIKDLAKLAKHCSSLTSLEVTGVDNWREDYLTSIARGLRADQSVSIRTVNFR